MLHIGGLEFYMLLSVGIPDVSGKIVAYKFNLSCKSRIVFFESVKRFGSFFNDPVISLRKRFIHGCISFKTTFKNTLDRRLILLHDL